MMPIVSQSFSASLMTCVEKTTVLPLSLHSRMKATMVLALMTSSPEVGSSKIITGGSLTSVPAGVRLIQAMKTAEVHHHFQRRQPAVEGRGGGEKAQILAGFFRLPSNNKTRDPSGARSGREDRRKHAQRGGLACSVCAEQAINLTRGAVEAEVLDSANCAPLLRSKFLAQIFRYDHSMSLAMSLAESLAQFLARWLPESAPEPRRAYGNLRFRGSIIRPGS